MSAQEKPAQETPTPETTFNMEKILSQIEAAPMSANVRTVFGEPITIGERTIIPVAQVGGGFGLGFGAGRRAPEQPGEAPSGQGGGGGAKLMARPVAVVEIAGDRVRVHPIIDVTRLALGGMLLAAWNVFWISLTIRTVRRFQRRWRGRRWRKGC